MFQRNHKINLKGLTLSELGEFFDKLGEENFRSKQLFLWLYQKKVSDIKNITNFSNELKNKINQIASIDSIELINVQKSDKTNTTKYLFKLFDGNFIESVLIPEKERNTLCISTQVGCPVYCTFCATGQMGFLRNLTTFEIIDQYIQVSNLSKNPITNIVYMGMGEPFLNWDNTLKSLDIFSSELAFGLSAKKITVSTVGIPEKIKIFADTNFKGKLAFSLHSVSEDIRTKLIPLNKKYSLKSNIEALEYFYKKTKRRITFEYTLIRGINDRKEDIEGLIKLTRQIPSKINIIPFNSIKHINPTGFSAELEPVSEDEFNSFVQKLRDKYVTVFVRNTQGDDIAGACGQLAINNQTFRGKE